jgi:hypothetical protein
MALSASHALHQYFHEDGGAKDHICLACSIANGQVNAAAVVLVSAMLTCGYLWSVLPVDILPFSVFDYRVSLSRAPPLD